MKIKFGLNCAKITINRNFGTKRAKSFILNELSRKAIVKHLIASHLKVDEAIYVADRIKLANVWFTGRGYVMVGI